MRRAAKRQRVQQEEAAKRMRQIQTEYAAETVLKSQRQEGGNTLYLVRWAHPYNHPSHDSWEPGQNLSTGLLRAFAGAEGAIPDDDAIAEWRRTSSLVGRRGVDPTVKGHAMWSFLKAVEGQHASKRSRQAPQQDIAAAASAQPATAAAPAASSPAAPAPAATGRGEGSEGSTPAQPPPSRSNDDPVGAPGGGSDLRSDTVAEAVAPSTTPPASKTSHAASGQTLVDVEVLGKKQDMLDA